MVIVLLKMIFWAVSAVSNVISVALFRAAAVVIVLAVQCLKPLAEGLVEVLDLTSSLARWVLETVVETLLEAAFSTVSLAFKHIPQATYRLATLASRNAAQLAEITRKRLELLLETTPEAAHAAAEMVHSILDSFLDSYKDAVKYIMKNI